MDFNTNPYCSKIQHMHFFTLNLNTIDIIPMNFMNTAQPVGKDFKWKQKKTALNILRLKAI
jgi:hypothetical protein